MQTEDALELYVQDEPSGAAAAVPGSAVAALPNRDRICVDNPENPAFSCAGMQQQESKLVTPASLAIDAVLVILFFAYMYSVVSTHVPSKDHRMILLWGGLG